MAEPASQLIHTNFRARYERARRLTLAEQLQECVDYLQNPEILVYEFLDAFFAIDIAAGSEEYSLRRQPLEVEPDDEDEIRLEYFFEDLEVELSEPEGYRFRCVATDVRPVPPNGNEQKEEPLGLDYVGLVGAPHDGVALGVVRSWAEPTPYLLLLRGLTCLAELAPAPQLERLSGDLLRGQLGTDALLDLHVVTWQGKEDEDLGTLAQLTHDLASVVKTELEEAWQFPNVLRSIACLGMDPDGFEGRLTLDWSV